MTIVDFGASFDLSEYSRDGSCCVAQALAFGAAPYIEFKKPKQHLNLLKDPSKFLGEYQKLGLPLGAIRRAIEKRGAALD